MRWIRGSRRMTVDLPVEKGETRLIREYRGQPPSYFVCGPLVFAPALAQAIPLYFRANPLLLADAGPLTARGTTGRASPTRSWWW